MLRRTVLSLGAVLLVLGLSGSAFAQKATVLRVLVVKTDNPTAYAQELTKGIELMKSMGIPATLRVWRARFAGPEAGSVVVSIEYPSLAAYAAADAKLSASSEYMAWLKGLDKIRTIVSDSLYNEL